jgi:hypothetical protein
MALLPGFWAMAKVTAGGIVYLFYRCLFCSKAGSILGLLIGTVRTKLDIGNLFQVDHSIFMNADD